MPTSPATAPRCYRRRPRRPSLALGMRPGRRQCRPPPSCTAPRAFAPVSQPFQALLDAIARIDHIPTDAQRLFHGRGGLYPGCEQWTLDAYPPAWLLTSFQPVPDDDLATVQAALQQRWDAIAPGQPLNLVFQHRDEVRATTRLLAGEVPDPHDVSEQGARFKVHLLRGMNHGLF